MAKLSTYIVEAGNRPLPENVSQKARHHVLDTLAAMVSGSRLNPGSLAIKYIRTQGGTPEAQVIGADFLSTAVNAAMANGFMAHADETDDSHAPSITHPGAAIVPAALAMAERENASGEAFLRAVVLGYDVSSRIARVMHAGEPKVEGHSTHSIGPLFGATAAAASLARFDTRQVRHALAYTGHQASGITSWTRDREHVEKAFVFAGMGARNGVTSVTFVQSGLSGEDDIFAGENNFLEVFCPSRDQLPKWIDSLGSHYDINITNIKKFSVGSPIQAPADAMSWLVKEHKLTADQVKKIDVHLPPRGAQVVNNRTMPDVNCQYIVAVILLDGKLTFKATQSYDRMSDPRVQQVRSLRKPDRGPAIPAPGAETTGVGPSSPERRPDGGETRSDGPGNRRQPHDPGRSRSQMPGPPPGRNREGPFGFSHSDNLGPGEGVLNAGAQAPAADLRHGSPIQFYGGALFLTFAEKLFELSLRAKRSNLIQKKIKENQIAASPASSAGSSQ